MGNTTTESEKKRKFIESFEKSGCVISAACQEADIEDSQTVYRWMAEDKKFKHFIMRMILEKTDYAEELEMDLIFRKKNTRAIIHYLDHCHPDYRKIRRKRLYRGRRTWTRWRVVYYKEL